MWKRKGEEGLRVDLVLILTRGWRCCPCWLKLCGQGLHHVASEDCCHEGLKIGVAMPVHMLLVLANGILDPEKSEEGVPKFQ